MSSPRPVAPFSERPHTSGAPPSAPWEVHQGAAVERRGPLGSAGGASLFVSHHPNEPGFFLGGKQIDREGAQAPDEERTRSFVATLILDPAGWVKQGLLGRQAEGSFFARSSPSAIHHERDPADDERFARRLETLFEEEPIEDGYDHPAEEVIRTALLDPGKQRLLLSLLDDS